MVILTLLPSELMTDRDLKINKIIPIFTRTVHEVNYIAPFLFLKFIHFSKECYIKDTKIKQDFVPLQYMTVNLYKIRIVFFSLIFNITSS